jgi:hypothetical protein
MSVPPHRVSDRVDQASNMALERSAGSPSLAAAAHRQRWADNWRGNGEDGPAGSVQLSTVY